MSNQETISRIANTLGEVEETPLAQIEGIVRALGEEGALALLTETLQIEQNGGMMYADGERRRSPGGVFFQLARRKLSPDDKKVIFREKKAPRADEAPASTPPPDASRLTRRRVVEVIPARPAARGKGAPFTPPELPSALTRARIRQQVVAAVTPLPLEEQYHLLLDLLADIHDRVVGGPPSEAAPSSRPAPRATGRGRRK